MAVIQSNEDFHKSLIENLNLMADISGAIAAKYFRGTYNLQEKSDKTPVTQADKEIELSLRDFIRNTYPNHGVLGEEFDPQNIESDYIWVIDPIDGTKAFATGKPLFGTIIGLAYKGRPILGLIDQPFIKERWIGDSYTGKTSYNGNGISVSSVDKLSDAKFYTANPEMFSADYKDSFYCIRDSAKWTLYGADCYAYGLLAMGFVDLVVEVGLGLHDIIGLVPIIENAGGFASNIKGEPITLQTYDGTIIASSSGNMAHQVMEILQRKM